MQDFINEQLAQIKLKHTPITRNLLLNYVLNLYKGTVEPTEENLKLELIDLNERGHLDSLFTTQLNPLTRQLLENYITYEYEDMAEFTEEHLITELIDLSVRGHLGALITAEWIYSKSRFQDDSKN